MGLYQRSLDTICRSDAEQRQREEQFEDAAGLYSQASVALMVTESLPISLPVKKKRFAAAIDDLSLALELDPSNHLAKLRLDTATLQLESEVLKAKLARA
ncbi:hypothetical protein PybrP1_010470 [[Pythium] brassicae (nom. inval.)]|nr:hypothetical protein PybrP1_010470 [[Pythium] brassicae (nom. inval.)]